MNTRSRLGTAVVTAVGLAAAVQVRTGGDRQDFLINNNLKVTTR